MTLTAENLKWYVSDVVDDTTSNGGVIDTAVEITTDTTDNILPSVSDAERVSGVTRYRKIFFRNENTDTYPACKLWIEANTPATNDTISIVLGSSNDTQAEADDYTYVAPTSKVHADVISISALAQNESQGIWVKQVVTDGGDGYTGNTFTLKVEP